MIIVTNRDGRVNIEDERVVLSVLANSDPHIKLQLPVGIIIDYRPFMVKWSDNDTASTQK